MREFLRWALPGLVVTGPAALLVPCDVSRDWPVLLLFSLPVGFFLTQFVRWRLESRSGGFRAPDRPALQVILQRSGLAARADAGDIAYQAYETVFYREPGWQAMRDHAHRCWDWIFLSRATAVGCVAGGVCAALGAIAGPYRPGALVLLALLAAAARVLAGKARETEEALHLLDSAWVRSHWPLYETALREQGQLD